MGKSKAGGRGFRHQGCQGCGERIPDPTHDFRCAMPFRFPPRSSCGDAEALGSPETGLLKREERWCPDQELNLDPRFRKPLLYPFELSGQTADDEWVPRNFLAAPCSACNPFVSPDSLADVQVPRSREGTGGCVQTAPFSTGCGAPFPACVDGELIRAAKTRRQAVLPSPGGQVRSGLRKPNLQAHFCKESL